MQNVQDDELELDIDELSQETLFQLYKFVQKNTPGGGSISVSARPKASHRESQQLTKPNKKNKPMSKNEQDARISELQGKLTNFHHSGSQSPELSLSP